MRSRLAVGGAAIAAALIAGVSLVSGLGFAPALARDTTSLECRQVGTTSTCVWPEHADRLGALAAVTAEALDGWRHVGIATPALVTEAHRAVAPASALAVDFTGVHGRDSAILALARAAVPPQPSCPGPQAGMPAATTGGSAEPYLEAWLTSAGGLSSHSFATVFADVPAIDGLSPADVVSQLGSAPADRRAAWMSKVVAELTTCDPVVPDITVGR